jgi:pimeloyl-ACP methyl ester carboxylesterase
MSDSPTTSVITIDGHAIEYRLERRGYATVLILHSGHISTRCRFGEETFLDAGYSVLVTSRPGYGRTEVGAGPSARPNSWFDWQVCVGYSISPT